MKIILLAAAHPAQIWVPIVGLFLIFVAWVVYEQPIRGIE